jgi:hypothetical protein
MLGFRSIRSNEGVAMFVIRILSEIMALGALVAAIGLTCIGLGG